MRKFRVHCALADCYYYLKEKDNPETGETNLIYCTYPERDLSDDNRPCPYYRMDWQKKMKLVQEKIQANKAARLKAQSQTQLPPEPAAPSPPVMEPTPPATPVPPIASSIPTQAAEPKRDESSPLPPPDALFELDKKTSTDEIKTVDPKSSSDSTPQSQPQ